MKKMTETDIIIPVGYCCRCGKYKVVNKRHNLCRFCNFERIHNKTYLEYQKVKSAENRRRIVEKMKAERLRGGMVEKNRKFCSVKDCMKIMFTYKYGIVCRKHYNEMRRNEKESERYDSRRIMSPNYNKINERNAKERKIKSELSKIKKAAKEKAYSDGNVCDGCGKRSSAVLDYSHILSVSQRKDLENDDRNKNMLCRSCHEKWESRDSEKLLSLKCLMDNMRYIREVDEGRFWRFYFIFNDAMRMDVCREMEDIDSSFKS